MIDERTPLIPRYEPRTYIPPAAKQAKVLSKNVIKMFSQIFMSDPKEILHKNGVDPYIFVRFLRMLAMAFVPIWVLSWVILMPVNSVGTTVDDMNGLDRFQFGNIARGKYSRYWAHLVLVWIFDLGFMYLIWKEMGVWLKIRIKYLSNPKHSQLPQASTVLITGIPPELMDERELARLFAPLPGGIQHIWLNRDLRDMPELWERRNKACDVLEKSQVKLLKEAAKWHTKRKGSGTPANRDAITLEDMFVPRGRRPTVRLKSGNDKRSGWGWLGIGNKVDAIEWARKEIAETTQQLRLARIQLGKDIHSKGAEGDVYAPKSSAFIQFHEQIAAHMAQQCVTYHAKFKMSSRYIEQSPSNVIWNNMSRSAYEVAVRSTAGTFIFIGIIIGWSPISAFIGAMSNITSLTKQLKWLEWLIGPGFGKMLLRGIATGILPPLLSALASMLFPILFRKMIVYEGGVSRTQVEMSVMTRFFIFLIIVSTNSCHN
jgi:hypothetical protein